MRYVKLSPCPSPFAFRTARRTLSKYGSYIYSEVTQEEITGERGGGAWTEVLRDRDDKVERSSFHHQPFLYVGCCTSKAIGNQWNLGSGLEV